MRRFRWFPTAIASMSGLLMLSACSIPPDHVNAGSGIYGRAWMRPAGVSVPISTAALTGRYFHVETPDGKGLIRTVVVMSDGTYNAPLMPGFYNIDVGGAPSQMVHVTPYQYVRLDLTFSDR